jgi:hypothetical protein
MPGRKKYAPPISVVKAEHARYLSADRPFRNRHVERVILVADEWVSEAVFDIVVGDAFDEVGQNFPG